MPPSQPTPRDPMAATSARGMLAAGTAPAQAAATSARALLAAAPPRAPLAAGLWAVAVRALAVGRRLAPLAALIAVVALAAWLRLAGLGSPATFLVDEPYYVNGAHSLLERGYEPTHQSPIPGELPAVHPPLGKWLIAAGILALGERPPGWRITPALAGIATVALIYLCARRLFPGRGPALAAALLLAIEGLSVVQSRTAMLDGILTFWLVAALYALLRDRDQADAAANLPARVTAPAPLTPPAQPRPPAWPAARAEPTVRRTRPASGSAGRRPWRLAAGLLLGCAVATKWSAAFVLPIAWLLTFAWAVRRRRAAGTPRTSAPASATAQAAIEDPLRAEAAGVIGALALLPVAIYLLSYAGTFITGTSTPATWWKDQLQVLEFHSTLGATHPYASSPLSWLVMRRPIVYFSSDAPGPGGVREVMALGNPLIFLAIVPTAAWAALRWWRARDHALAVPLLLALALWLPWVPQDRPMFIYYMTPVMPFVALMQGAAIARIAQARNRAGPALAGAAIAAAIALLWLHWPVLTGAPLTEHAWALRVANWARIPLLRFNWI